MTIVPTLACLRRRRRAAAVVAAVALLAAAPLQATPEKAATFYEDALKRYEANDVPGAVIQLKNAIQQDNRMLAAHLLLGKALVKNGDLRAAEVAFEEALKQGVSRSEVALPLGQLYLALGRPDQVIDRIQPGGLPPALQVEVLSMRGTAYYEAGKPREAIRSLDEARAIDPRSPVPWITETPVHLGGGNLDKARQTAAKAVELGPSNAYAWNMRASVKHAALEATAALTDYDRALELEPRLVDSRVARAALYLDLNRNADAASDLEYLKANAPGEPRAAYLRAVLAARNADNAAITANLNDAVRIIDALPPPWLAGREQLLMVGALSHHGLGNWEKARDYLNIILNRYPRNFGAKKLLASIYVEIRDYSRALSLLEALYKVAPDDPQVLYLLGSVHLAQRRYVQASEFLEKAAARAGSADANRALAFSQLGLGRGNLGIASLERSFAADPSDIRSGAALAHLYLRRGDQAKALATAKAMVARLPANPVALNFQGSVKAATGDRAGARVDFAQVIARNPTFTPAAINLARLDVVDGNYDEARRRLNELLAKKRDDPDLLADLGQVEQRAGRNDEAIRNYRKAIEVQRKDPRAGLLLIDLYLGQRRIEEALAVAKDQATKHPGSLPAQLALGRVYLAAGDAANARAVFLSATRLAEFDPGMQVRIARLQIAAGNPDGAAYNVQKALQGRPDDPSALSVAVEIEARRGDAAKADAALKVLAAKHPQRVETSLATGNLAMLRGQYPAAASAYRAALDREPTTANALNLVRAQIAGGDTAKAAAFLAEWTRTHPDDVVALKALAESQYRAGQLEAAKASYARVTALEPDDAVTLNNYANLLQRLGDPLARQYSERAVKLVPNNPSFADTLGWILAQAGETDAALRQLREARLRAPENGEIRFHLAWTLNKAGRKAEAREELQAALTGPGRIAQDDAVMRLKAEVGLAR